MRVYTMLRPQQLDAFPEGARRAESLGFDGITLLELTVPPTLSAVAAAMSTTDLDILTGVFVAFPRSPMATAYDAWSIQSLSKGRFQLGLGSQIKTHLRRRWSTEVLPVIPRMREYIESMRAIWDCWQNGSRLAYEGEYYQFSLMIPYYNPGPIAHPGIPIYLAAINKRMCQLTGAIADGHLPGDPVTHKWFCEVMLPNLEKGAASTGRTLSDLDLGSHGFIGCASTEAGLERVRKGLRERIALYASTPDYKKLLEMHGWGDMLGTFIDMARQGKWSEMGELVTDEMLDQYAIVGTPDEVPGKLEARFGGITRRVQLDDEWFDGLGDDDIRSLVKNIQAIA
jgi:probable F420-dependent oxidoreductase